MEDFKPEKLNIESVTSFGLSEAEEAELISKSIILLLTCQYLLDSSEEVTPYLAEACTGPWIKTYHRAKELGVALPGTCTTESGEAQNRFVNINFNSNTMHGGGTDKQQDVPKVLLELYSIELLNKIIENGKLDEFKQWTEICKKKGDQYMSSSGPVTEAKNLFQGHKSR